MTGFLNAAYFAVLNSEALDEVICSPLTGTDGKGTLGKAVLVLSFMVTAYFSATTAFLHTLLTVVRCINISSPFYRVGRTRVKVAIATYLTLVALSVLADTSYFLYRSYGGEPDVTERWIYFSIFVRVPSFVKLNMIEDGSNKWNFPLHLLLDLAIPYVLPSLICIVCLGILVYAVTTRQQAPRIPRGEARRTQHHITFTVTMLTALFVVCNSFQMGLIGLMKYNNSKGIASVWPPTTLAIALCIVPLLNSSLDPFIFIMRSKALKNYINTSFRRISLHRAVLTASKEEEKSGNSFGKGKRVKINISTV